MADRILRRREVEARIGLSRSIIYAGVAGGDFPKHLQSGRRAVGWQESVIARWLDERPNGSESTKRCGAGPLL